MKLRKPWRKIEKLLRKATLSPLAERELILVELRAYATKHGVPDYFQFDVMDLPSAEIIPFPGRGAS
jgi:hypothetical protein